jgi:hypothetical protein
MYLAQGPQDIQNVEVVMVMAAIVVAAFWRILLRIALAAIVAFVLVAIGYGVVAFMHAAHS